MIKKYTPLPYNAGVVEFGSIRPIYPAGVNKKIGEEIQRMGKCYFDISTVRQQDYELAAALGRRITKKIRIPAHVSVTQEHKARIDGVVYDIISIDYDGTQQYLNLERAEAMS